AGGGGTGRGTAAVSADPDVAFVVDCYTVVGLGPFVTRTIATPMVKKVFFLNEFEHWRRRHAALRCWRVCRRIHFLWFERAAAMDDPYVILSVDRYSYGIT